MKKKLKDLTLEQILKIAQDSEEKNGCCSKCPFWKINFNCEFLCNYGNRKNERLKKILNYKVEVEDNEEEN